MTKLEYLRNLIGKGDIVYPAGICSGNLDILFHWKALGRNLLDLNTKIYNKDAIYYVNVGGSALDGYIIYCNQGFVSDGTTNFKWADGKLHDYDFGEITFGNNIVSPYFTVLLTLEETSTAAIEGTTVPDTFIPYYGIQDTGCVRISEDDYRRCLTCLGYPAVSEDMLEYTRDEITELAIKPALEEYFHWLPSLIETTVDGSNEQEVDMPSEAYACVGVSLQQYGTSASSLCMSPMSYAMESSLWGGYSGGQFYGMKNYSASGMRNGSALVAGLERRALTQALVNYNRRVHYEGPYTRADGSRYIKIYSNVNGTFNIWWAKRTLDFNDVEYANRTRVFEYAQANIKELFANLRRQVKSDIPGLVNYGEWMNEAAETKKRITEELKSMVKSSGIMRGGLG